MMATNETKFQLQAYGDNGCASFEFRMPVMARRWQKTQSFLMATWFFAELQRMTAARTLCLLGCACALAFMTNIGRIYYLAQIRFNQLNTLLALNSAR